MNLTSEIKQLYIPNQKTTDLLYAKPQTDSFVHPKPVRFIFHQEGLLWKEFITKEMTMVHKRSQQCSTGWATGNWICLFCWIIESAGVPHWACISMQWPPAPGHNLSSATATCTSEVTAWTLQPRTEPQGICKLVLHRGWWVSPDQKAQHEHGEDAGGCKVLSAVTSYSTTQNKHYAQTYFLHKVWLLQFGKSKVTQAALPPTLS